MIRIAAQAHITHVPLGEGAFVGRTVFALYGLAMQKPASSQSVGMARLPLLQIP